MILLIVCSTRIYCRFYWETPSNCHQFCSVPGWSHNVGIGTIICSAGVYLNFILGFHSDFLLIEICCLQITSLLVLLSAVEDKKKKVISQHIIKFFADCWPFHRWFWGVLVCHCGVHLHLWDSSGSKLQSNGWYWLSDTQYLMNTCDLKCWVNKNFY